MLERTLYTIHVSVFLTRPRAKFQSQGNKCPLVCVSNQGLEIIYTVPKNKILKSLYFSDTHYHKKGDFFN
jgi:hypothetical protein